MEGQKTILIDPNTNETREFAFDHSFWSHDGFTTDETVQNAFNTNLGEMH